MKGDDIAERLIGFAVLVRKVVNSLPDTLTGRHLAGQLLRAGTSPGANYEEARGAESRRDFLHKLGITLKELQESRYWLKVIHRSDLISRRMLSNPPCKRLTSSFASSAPRNAPPEPARSKEGNLI